MRCPHDQAELERVRYESDVQIDECPRCHGVWLDPGELRTIQETLERNYAEILRRPPPDGCLDAYRMARQARADRIACPVCGCEMNRREYGYCSQVMIDECTCGTWLDAGEIERLEVFFERNRSVHAPGFLARLKIALQGR
ncbi:zf-TFIIB domain-containing protein [Myxococcota bacterium]|nr:zf-TFIIB domain-containing protein [Myxococcota bacterium]